MLKNSCFNQFKLSKILAIDILNLSPFVNIKKIL